MRARQGGARFLTQVVPVWLYLAGVFIAGSARGSLGPTLDLGAHTDKWMHFLVFGALYPLVFRAERFGHPARTVASQTAWSLLWIAVLGGALELYQSLLPHRQAEWGDWFANLAGGFLAAALVALGLFARRRLRPPS